MLLLSVSWCSFWRPTLTVSKREKKSPLSFNEKKSWIPAGAQIVRWFYPYALPHLFRLNSGPVQSQSVKFPSPSSTSDTEASNMVLLYLETLGTRRAVLVDFWSGLSIEKWGLYCKVQWGFGWCHSQPNSAFVWCSTYTVLKVSVPAHLLANKLKYHTCSKIIWLQSRANFLGAVVAQGLSTTHIRRP